MFSLSVRDDKELNEDVLEWRSERRVGRQIRKLGLFEWVGVVNEADDDEYWEIVRRRPPVYVRDDEDNDDDDDVDSAGERKRDERVGFAIV